MPTKSLLKTPSTTNRNIPMPEDWLARLRQPPPHPGPVFRTEFREPLGISQRDAAARLGFTAYYWNQIELGRKPVMPDTCVKLEAITRVSAEFWARLQMHHDLWKSIQKMKRGELAVGEPFPKVGR